MSRWVAGTFIIALGVLVVAAAYTVASAADVKIGVNIGVPAPVIVAPPPVVVAPPPPPPFVVAPTAPIYFYGNGYYTYYNGAWFFGPGHAGPWAYVAGPPPWERHPEERHWREGHVRGGRHWRD